MNDKAFKEDDLEVIGAEKEQVASVGEGEKIEAAETSFNSAGTAPNAVVSSFATGNGANGGDGGGGGGANGSRTKRGRGGKHSKQGADNVDNARFHCNYCGRDLSNTIRVRCADCTDFDLCLDCFSVGATLWPHTPTHAYRLIEVVTKPVFSESWGADEEERLLEGLEMYGVGNWEDISRVIMTRSKRETDMHFESVYLQSPLAPIPNSEKMCPKDDPEWVKEEPDPDPKILKVMHLHQNQAVAGWMPKREDFLYEWDNEAEDVIAEMEITEEDSKQDKELKSRVLEIYSTKLDERKRRKEFVVNRGLLDLKAQEQADKKRPREERELRDRMRVYSRLHSDADHKALLKGILQERSVRQARRRLGAGGGMSASAGKGKGRIGDGMDGSTNGGPAEAKKDPAWVSEGAELLSRYEIELCQSIKMTFHQYMIVKEAMIRESMRNSSLRKKDATGLIKMDPNKALRIYDYLVACKLVNPGTQKSIGTANSANGGAQQRTANGVAKS